MNKTRATKTASKTPQPVQVITHEHQDDEQSLADPLNMSPERIMEGASTKTEVLVGILARTEEHHPWRHWGINE